MQVSEYVEHDATGLARLISSGQVSADEVRQAALQAIEAVNGELNALVGEPFEEPLSYEADGPLSGVPFLIKDLVLHAEGVPTRSGSRMTGEGITFPYDSELMARFRSAGLATLGRTTTPEFGFNASTESVLTGPTRNPWNPARSAGGSSGGSGALVAARAVPLAHANDGGGSIRIPAAANGLVGLKPTRGRVTLGPDFAEALSGAAVELAVTRTVRDCAALLDAVSGPGVGDKYFAAPPERPFAEEVGAQPGNLACFEAGSRLTALDMLEAEALQNQVTRAVGRWFLDYDALLTPTLAHATFPLGLLDADDPSLDARGWYDKIFLHAPFTALFNMTGQPAMSLPVMATENGGPVGTQLVARFGEEAALIRLAAQLEEARPWNERRPPVCAGTS